MSEVPSLLTGDAFVFGNLVKQARQYWGVAGSIVSHFRIRLAAGVTDMRAGMNGLAAKVETAMTEDPYCGHVFVFRGRRGDMVSVVVVRRWPAPAGKAP